MSSQLGTVAGLLLKAKWEKFLALREISEFSHSLGQLRSFELAENEAANGTPLAKKFRYLSSWLTDDLAAM